MPLSTRLWLVTGLAAAAFCGWALFWPVPVPTAIEADGRALPGYPSASASPAAAPNPADPGWTRPLFFSDRRPRQAVVDESAGAGNVGGDFAPSLTGILRSGRVSLATISPGPDGKPRRVRLGEEVEGMPGWRLASLGTRSATFRNGDQERVLTIDAREARNNPLAPAAPVPPMAVTDVPRTTGAPRPPTGIAVSPAAPGGSGAVAAAPPAVDPANTRRPAGGTDASADAIDSTQQQQVDAIRRRIDEARRNMRQPSSSNPSR